MQPSRNLNWNFDYSKAGGNLLSDEQLADIVALQAGQKIKLNTLRQAQGQAPAQRHGERQNL
jgi:hypothetical protein